MKQIHTIFIIFSIITFSYCLHLQKQKHQRTISYECCVSQGGFQCGLLIKQCCVLPKGLTQAEVSSKNCLKGGFLGSSQFCPGQAIIKQCNYCHEQCEKKGGKICGWGSTGSPQCCKQTSCITSINQQLNMKTCKPQSQIKLQSCIKDMTVIDSVLEKVYQIF